MNSILFITAGIYHPSFLSIQKVKRALEGLSRFEITWVKKFEDIMEMELSHFTCVVLFFHQKEKKVHTYFIEKVIEYVQNGGNLLALHGATASFKENIDYINVLGAKFLDHDKIMKINVTGFLEFTVKDELYDHHLSDDCEVLLCGNKKPVYWRRNVKKGRVACFTLGHKKKIYDNPKTTAVIYHALDYLI